MAKCVGTLELRRLVIRDGRPVKPVLLKRVKYSLEQNESDVLVLRLKRKERKRIRRAGGLRGEIVAVEPDVLERPKTTTQPLKLSAAKPRA